MASRGWQELREYKIVDCDEDCSVCAHIRNEAFTKNWCFQWLQELEDMDLSGKIDGGHIQVHLQPKKSDETVSDIRAKLAELQTRTPVWTLLDYIKDNAMELASRESGTLLIQKYQNTVFESCNCISCQHPGKVQEWKIKCQTRQATLTIIQRNLKKFVQKHVFMLLTELYRKIHEVEEMITREGENEQKFQKIFQAIYDQDNQPIGLQNEMRTHRSKISLVGPVGERPLHVCALSAHRYNDVDFEKMGNYVKDGITHGLRQYIESNQLNTDEICVRYGKDYCAAIGSFLNANLQEPTMEDVERKLSIKLNGAMPPFWQKISSWSKEHRDSKLRCCVFPLYVTEEQTNDMKIMATVGLYEGETVLYPMIAGGDLDTVNWMLLQTETKGEDMSEPTPGRPKSLALLPVDGLFFRPIRRRQLTSFGVLEGWKYYMNVRFRDENLDASSPKSYFGLNVLSFAVSQGNVEIFDLIFCNLEKLVQAFFAKEPRDNDKHIEAFQYFGKLDNDRDGIRAGLIRRALLGLQDEYGNTLLHLAAWNDKQAMYDRLIQMGARDDVKNNDGVNAFGLTARYGMWSMFHHIWDRHLTRTVWRFGNVEKTVVDYSSFDWKGLVGFHTRSEVRNCLIYAIQRYVIHVKETDVHFERHTARGAVRNAGATLNGEGSTGKYLSDLQSKIQKAQSKVQEWEKSRVRSSVMQYAHKLLHDGNEYNGNAGNHDVFGRRSVDGMSVVRMITLFRPTNWYEATKGKVEELILRKWAQGFYLIHLGQNVIPYIVVLLIFCIMWSLRQVDVLEHNFWWADSRAASIISNAGRGASSLLNPVRANVSELQLVLNTSVFGSDAASLGRLPRSLFGPEHECGWKSLASSNSGRLQAALFLYSVPCLLRLAWTQRRVRASDLDGSQDMKISFEEVVNFIYFNLESLLHTAMCGLLITIPVERVRAGEQCAVEHVRGEKNAISVACLFLFLNLFVSCKPYKELGFLVLTIYKFLVSDVFNFLVMYCMFFAGFLLALQTIHNANHVFLAWVEYTTSIFPQIQAVTGGKAFMANANIPSSATNIGQTHMAVDGCQVAMRTIYDTAFSLLEISFGDGLADALQQARGNDFECAGFMQDRLVGFILVFWVFLTNVLVLNMLIAMMNSTMERQQTQVHLVWLLDVSYRIMRYEKLFPELLRRLQAPEMRYSIWSYGYWKRAFLNMCLAIYCCPEVHLWGYSRAVLDQCWRIFTCRRFLRLGSGAANRKIHDVVIQEIMNSDILTKRSHHGKQESNTQTRSQIVSQKTANFARREGVYKQVERWREEIQSEPASKPEDRLLSLYLVALISQLDVLLSSFDDSLAIHQVNALEGLKG